MPTGIKHLLGSSVTLLLLLTLIAWVDGAWHVTGVKLGTPVVTVYLDTGWNRAVVSWFPGENTWWIMGERGDRWNGPEGWGLYLQHDYPGVGWTWNKRDKFSQVGTYMIAASHWLIALVLAAPTTAYLRFLMRRRRRASLVEPTSE